jgi:hypothetical protein
MARLDETYRVSLFQHQILLAEVTWLLKLRLWLWSQKTLDDSSSYDVQIDLDVPRTISGHILFHTRYGHG